MNAIITNISTLFTSDIKEYFRIKFIIMSSALMPITMMLSFGAGIGNTALFNMNEPYFTFIMPSIVALGTMFSALFAGGYIIIIDRQQSVIRDMMLSPVSYSSYVIARLCASVVKTFPQFIIAIVVAIPFLEAFGISNPTMLLIAFLLTGWLFSAIGMILGSFSNILTFPGIANLVLMPSMYFCGVFFPLSEFGGLSVFVQALPFTSAVELIRYAVNGTSPLYGVVINFAFLATYAIVFTLVWIYMFKRQLRCV